MTVGSSSDVDDLVKKVNIRDKSHYRRDVVNPGDISELRDSDEMAARACKLHHYEG